MIFPIIEEEGLCTICATSTEEATVVIKTRANKLERRDLFIIYYERKSSFVSSTKFFFVKAIYHFYADDVGNFCTA